jgi:hypothetical protein
MVTFWPADVVIVKLDLDTLATVPDAPLWAGADRALDAPVPAALAATSSAAVAEGDVARLTGSPIAAHISAAAAIRPLLLFSSNRRTFGRRACLAIGTEADQSGEKAGGGDGAAPAPLELPGSDGSEVALSLGMPERASSGFVGPKSFMIALLLVSSYVQSAGRSWEVPPRPLNGACDGIENHVRMYRSGYGTSTARGLVVGGREVHQSDLASPRLAVSHAVARQEEPGFMLTTGEDVEIHALT